jgi:tetratricopeptide (TPR) repeat protein
MGNSNSQQPHTQGGAEAFTGRDTNRRKEPKSAIRSTGTVKSRAESSRQMKITRKRRGANIEIRDGSSGSDSPPQQHIVTTPERSEEGSEEESPDLLSSPMSHATIATAPDSCDRSLMSAFHEEVDSPMISLLEEHAHDEEGAQRNCIMDMTTILEERQSDDSSPRLTDDEKTSTQASDSSSDDNKAAVIDMQAGFAALEHEWKSTKDLQPKQLFALQKSPTNDTLDSTHDDDDDSTPEDYNPNHCVELDEVMGEDTSDGGSALSEDFDQMMEELDHDYDGLAHDDDKYDDDIELADSGSIDHDAENDDDGSIGSNSMFSQSSGSEYSLGNRSMGYSIGDLSVTPSTASLIHNRRLSLGGPLKASMTTSFRSNRPAQPTANNAFETLPRHLIKNSLLRQAAATLRDERFLNRRITKLGAVYASKVHVSDFVCMDQKILQESETIEMERNSLEASMPTAATFADGEDLDCVTIDSFELFEKCILELCGIQMVEFDVTDGEGLSEDDEDADMNTPATTKPIGETSDVKPGPQIARSDGGRALYSLGKYCQKAGWNDDAMHFYKHALYLYFLDVGVEEPRLLDNSDDCDGFFYVQGARACVRKSSPTHQYLAIVFTKMGDIHGKCGENNDALRAYRASEVFWRKYISDLTDSEPEDATDIITAVEALALSFNRIGGVYTAKGELHAAVAACHEALEMQVDTLGEEHIEVAKTLHNIGVCHRHSDDWDSALKFYVQAHHVFEINLGRDHLDTVRTLHNIGGVYRRRKEYAKAMECFKEVLVVRRNLLGDNHPSVSIALVSMAATLRRSGRKAEAMKFYAAAVH